MTSSLLAARRGSQTPRVANYPPYPISAAPEVIELAASAGLHLDEWQQYVLTHGLGQRLDDAWTARKVSVWVPRQNGKGGIIEALELAWLFLFEEDLVVHSAHQHRTSQKAYERLERIIRRTPDLHRRVAQYRQANGEQQIELRDGRMLQYTTRSRTAVRGFSAPKLVLDEAQELDNEQMAAMLPTVSAMPNWQVWFFGTPPDRPTAWVYGLKADGEAKAPRLAHFDWGTDLNPDDKADREKTHDRDLWYACNPALGIRITEETVEDEDKPSGLGDKFAQERLGAWQPRSTGGAGVITEALWKDLADRDADRPTNVAFTIDVAPDRRSASVSMVGVRDDGLVQVAVVEHRPGTDWIPERAKALREKWEPICWAVDGKVAAETLSDSLAVVGITVPEDPERPHRGCLVVLGPVETAAAWALFVDAANQRRLRHSDDVPLNLALRSAKTRPLAGGQAWAQQGPDPINPLVGVTNGFWAEQTYRDLVAESDPGIFWL